MDSRFTIIAATNFSPIAVNAVIYAAKVANATGAKLLLFNSFSLPLHSANSHISADALQTQIDRVSEKLSTMAAELSQLYGIETSYNCSYSFLEDQLPKLVEETRAELVVMGMASRSLEQELIGNSTTLMIKNLKTPVLAVPAAAKFHNVKKVLLAFDTERKIAAGKLLWLSEAVKNIKAEIEFFSVDEAVDMLTSFDSVALAKNMLDKEFQKVKYVYKTVRSNAVIEEIEKEIGRYGADILVMIPQKYGFWDSLVHRSKTRVLAAGLNIPLLAVPNY